MNSILDSYVKDLVSGRVSIDHLEKRNNTIVDFRDELHAKGVDLYKYILWHQLIGSTVTEDMAELDTPDHDIENFIRGL